MTSGAGRESHFVGRRSRSRRPSSHSAVRGNRRRRGWAPAGASAVAPGLPGRIHPPGSELFRVLDTGYLTDDDPDPRLHRWTRRTAVMKVTCLKSF